MARNKKLYPLQDLPGLFDDYADHPNKGASIDFTSENPTIQRPQQSKPSPEIQPLKPAELSPRLKFISFGSGSSGNSAYIGDDNSGILIDAGVDNNRVVSELAKNGISMDKVKAICLTHDHGDHIRFAYSIVRRYRHIGIYCTLRTLNGIMRRHNISRRFKDYHRPIFKENPFVVDNFKITAFDVSHDGTDNMGFFIENGKHKFTIATDLGCITPRVDHYMRKAQYIMIESNYDKEMLITGKYPEYLKARILADKGHLDNEVTARYIAEIYTPKLTHVFLCHLSNDNNTPNIALATVSKPLFERGLKIGDATESATSNDADIQITPLPRHESSILYILR